MSYIRPRGKCAYVTLRRMVVSYSVSVQIRPERFEIKPVIAKHLNNLLMNVLIIPYNK